MVDSISPAALAERLGSDSQPQIIDVRSAAAFRRGHIPGAENVPIHRFTQDVAEREWSSEVVFVCPKGESSLQAARLLESFEGTGPETRILNLAGGYESWEGDLEAEPDVGSNDSDPRSETDVDQR